MMEHIDELKALIESFRAYREVLSPLQETMNSLVNSYEMINNDLIKLEKALGEDTKIQIESIYSTLKSQSENSKKLSEKIEQFVSASDKYSQVIDGVYNKFSIIENKLNSINEIEKNAEIQLKKIEEIVNEKKINYNIKDLQKSLETYNRNVEKISEFINKDVADVLVENSKKIDAVNKSNTELYSLVNSQNKTLEDMIVSYQTTAKFLREAVQKDSVNEEYLFAVLDKWATSRKVKIKK